MKHLTKFLNVEEWDMRKSFSARLRSEWEVLLGRCRLELRVG
jgi:hypothetical protein